MSSCLFVDANLGAPRVCVVACKRTVAVVVAVEVAVPIAVAGAEPRSSSRSGTSRAAIHCGLSGFWIFGVFGVWMFWTSVVEFGSPNMFWILVLSSCVGSWTSHSALELRFLILFWHLVRPACIAILAQCVATSFFRSYCQSMAVVNLEQAMKKLEKDGSTEGTRTASSQHKVHCIPANVSSDKCRSSLNLRS